MHIAIHGRAMTSGVRGSVGTEIRIEAGNTT
jgi:hypothetical protein